MASIEEIIKAINALPLDTPRQGMIKLYRAVVDFAERQVQEDAHKSEDVCPDCSGTGEIAPSDATLATFTLGVQCSRCRGDKNYHPQKSER